MGRQWGSLQRSYVQANATKLSFGDYFFNCHWSCIVILGMICGLNGFTTFFWSILQKAQSLLVRDYPFKGLFSKQWWEYINNQQNDARKCPKGQIKHIRSIKSIHSGQCFRRYTVAYRSTTAHLQRRCRVEICYCATIWFIDQRSQILAVYGGQRTLYTLWVKWTCLGSKNG